jgi:hypothetical protein
VAPRAEGGRAQGPPPHVTSTSLRNRPEADGVSHMSKYLHFGQISPVYVALQVREAATREENRADYLEELVVRRELAHNFVNVTEEYDLYTCLPGWARTTLDEHRDDERPHLYSKAQLDAAGTRDPYWNAAMREMKHTGYMHNHMRMYWGKKILEWSRTPEVGLQSRPGSQQQILPRRPGLRVVRQRRLDLRPARPPLAGAGRVRERPFDVGRRPGAQGRHGLLRRSRGRTRPAGAGAPMALSPTGRRPRRGSHQCGSLRNGA